MEPTKLDYLVAECFCAENNGDFRDILQRYHGKPVTPDDTLQLRSKIAKELLDFAARQNKADLVDKDIAFMFARAELVYRIDFEHNIFQTYSYMDVVRWDLILSQDN